jgi:hypothetical protein
MLLACITLIFPKRRSQALYLDHSHPVSRLKGLYQKAHTPAADLEPGSNARRVNINIITRRSCSNYM